MAFALSSSTNNINAKLILYSTIHSFQHKSTKNVKNWKGYAVCAGPKPYNNHILARTTQSASFVEIKCEINKWANLQMHCIYNSTVLVQTIQIGFVPDAIPKIWSDFFYAFRLIESQLHQSEQSKEFQQRVHELKGSLSSTELEVSKWKARYDALMEQHQGLDLTMTDLDNRCEVKAAFPPSGHCRGTKISAEV